MRYDDSSSKKLRAAYYNDILEKEEKLQEQQAMTIDEALEQIEQQSNPILLDDQQGLQKKDSGHSKGIPGSIQKTASIIDLHIEQKLRS